MQLPPFLVAAAAVSGVAAWYDHRTGEIPDWVSIPPLVVAPGVHVVTALVGGADRGAALQPLGASLFGAIAAAALPCFMFRANAIGGGDVKLFAAIGALCTAWTALCVETYAFVFAALFAVAWLARTGALSRVLRNALALSLGRKPLAFSPLPAVSPLEGAAPSTDAAPPDVSRGSDPIAGRGYTAMRLGPAIFVATCFQLYVTGRGTP